MKKLTLRLDSLRVESFQASPEPAPGRGTVHGYSDPVYGCVKTQGTTCPYTCDDATWRV